MPIPQNRSGTDLVLVSLFIRTTDLGFLKSLCSKARFFDFGPARKIRDTNDLVVVVVVVVVA